MLNEAKVARSLETRALPKGKHTPIEDGRYIPPLGEKWYSIRWESEQMANQPPITFQI